MKKLKILIPILIIFLTIGFAAVNYTLSIDGNTNLTGDLEDFKVYYSKAEVNGVTDVTIVKSETELSFTNILKEPGSEYKIEYEVTNASKYFDASITITCTQGNEHLSVVNNFDTTTNLEALSTRTGTLTLKKLKSYASYESKISNISCSLVATPISRDSTAEGEPPSPLEEYHPTLLTREELSETSFIEYHSFIRTLTFESEINIPESAIESWDISTTQKGEIMAYIVKNENENEYYDLYIQTAAKEIYGNPDMSEWFSEMDSMNTINNFNLLNTSRVTDMSYMFSGLAFGTGWISIDFGKNFVTNNVTNMSHMFSDCGINSIDLTRWDTSKVTDMSYMFYYAHSLTSIEGIETLDTSNVTNMSNMFYYTDLTTLDITQWDTSKVTDMSRMFSEIYNLTSIKGIETLDTSNVTDMSDMFNYGSVTNLDLSEWNTSKVTNMAGMFYSSYTNSIDLTGWDTSNVTNMSGMFALTESLQSLYGLNTFDTSNVKSMCEMFLNTGYNSADFELDVSNFDTSNVTDMGFMFSGTGYNSTKLNTSITIKNPNVTSYSNMFKDVATKSGTSFVVNYTNETSDLVDAMIATKSEESNVIKGYNVENIITFEIEGTEYEAYEGMTWQQWINSSFNTEYFIDSNDLDYIKPKDNTSAFITYTAITVRPSDKIITGATYDLDPC